MQTGQCLIAPQSQNQPRNGSLNLHFKLVQKLFNIGKMTHFPFKYIIKYSLKAAAQILGELQLVCFWDRESRIVCPPVSKHRQAFTWIENVRGEISEELLWQQALSLLIQTFCLSLNKFIQPRLKQMTSKRQQQPRHNVTAVSSRAFCSLCYKFSAGRYCALKTDSPGVKNRRDLEQPKKKEERIRLQSSGSHVSDWLHMGDPLNFHLFGGSNRSSDSQ